MISGRIFSMSPPKSYYLSRNLRIGMLIFSVVMSIASIILLVLLINLLLWAFYLYPFNILITIGIVMIMVLEAVVCIAIANVLLARLTISDIGVEYRTYWYKVYTTWSNIRSVAVLRFGFDLAEGLTFFQPVKATISLPFLLFFDKEVGAIPVSMFGVSIEDIEQHIGSG